MNPQETARDDTMHSKNTHGYTRKTKGSSKTSFYYTVIQHRILNGRDYQLLKITLPSVGRKTRIKMLESFLEDKDAIGIIEWWSHGSIAEKPWREFYIILILKR
jgi:hypothetical protein